MEEGPCFVSFSGGRDSSAILAVATDVARRHGLDPPVPVTNVFPHLPQTNEDEWQRLVVDHIGIPSWERLEIGDELDYLGPHACAGLERHGQLYPANAHFQVPALQRASGGTLLTGWGGDDVFASWRLDRLGAILRGRARPTRRDARRLAVWSLPAPARRAVLRRFGHLPQTQWLTPGARRRFFREWAADYGGQPRPFDARVGWLRRHRYMWATERTLAALAEDAGARVLHPFVESRFLSALARAGGRLGLGDRTSTWRQLFADLLPAPLLERSSKAFFGDALVGARSLRFIEEWRGEGVDPDVVDKQALMASLRHPNTAYRLGLLIQWAWLVRLKPE